MRALNDVNSIHNGLIARLDNIYRLKVETRDEELRPTARAFIPLDKNGQDLSGTTPFEVQLHVDQEAVRAFQADGDHKRVIGSGEIKRGSQTVAVNLFPASGGFIGVKPKKLPEGEGAMDDFA